MKKSILIFGGGLNQLSLVNTARNLDLISVVIDPSFEAPAREVADFFYTVERNDYETTKKIAVNHHVSGIVTGQMENPLHLMARLADDLGFIFHSKDIVRRCTNKLLMKKSWQDHGVPCAKGIHFSPDEKISSDLLASLTYPLILKPVDSFSSRGVYKINLFAEIDQYISETRSFASNGSVLIEEFVDGPEYSIETITYMGKTTVIQYTEKFITPFPNTVEMGHLQPANLTEEQKSEMNKVVINAINALGIDNSAAHAELKWTDDGPKMIEIGARLGGDFISSYLTLASTGINMDKAAIQVAFGEKPELRQLYNKYSYIKYFELEADRVVKKIENYDDILLNDEVIQIGVFLQPGDKTSRICHSGVRSGFVLVQGDSRDAVLTYANKYAKSLANKIILE
ncbi:MAG: ATP-grasp domain-containing protein [Leptospiraceae bacterium]|nr:ATP-grasp domain-containing protein [candidate division KSB1 bacterium]MCP5498218.1 ATP-grasp domain-containing protein [Leptospiraceae bacterium]